MYFFTADEHYGHTNIITHCNRPFSSTAEMNEVIIFRHNSKVGCDDVTIHAGDFCWVNNKKDIVQYVSKLNGNHIFLKGSHDGWLPNSAKHIWRERINNQLVVVCHYAMRRWECSHYNSWQLYGHSHGRLKPKGKQHDIGVDNNNFYPLSFDEIVEIMKTRKDNIRLLKEN